MADRLQQKFTQEPCLGPEVFHEPYGTWGWILAHTSPLPGPRGQLQLRWLSQSGLRGYIFPGPHFEAGVSLFKKWWWFYFTLSPVIKRNQVERWVPCPFSILSAPPTDVGTCSFSCKCTEPCRESGNHCPFSRPPWWPHHTCWLSTLEDPSPHYLTMQSRVALTMYLILISSWP